MNIKHTMILEEKRLHDMPQGVTYGPIRWFDSLGHNLVNTEDSVSFVDILEVSLELWHLFLDFIWVGLILFTPPYVPRHSSQPPLVGPFMLPRLCSGGGGGRRGKWKKF